MSPLGVVAWNNTQASEFKFASATLIRISILWVLGSSAHEPFFNNGSALTGLFLSFQGGPIQNRKSKRCLELAASNDNEFGYQLVLQKCTGQKWFITNVLFNSSLWSAIQRKAANSTLDIYWTSVCLCGWVCVFASAKERQKSDIRTTHGWTCLFCAPQCRLWSDILVFLQLADCFFQIWQVWILIYLVVNSAQSYFLLT